MLEAALADRHAVDEGAAEALQIVCPHLAGVRRLRDPAMAARHRFVVDLNVARRVPADQDRAPPDRELLPVERSDDGDEPGNVRSRLRRDGCWHGFCSRMGVRGIYNFLRRRQP